jgi:phosphoglycolate phosphatase
MRDHVLFDLDGTIADPRVGFVASIRHALERLGRQAPSDDAIAAHIGPPLEGTLAVLLDTSDTALIARGKALYRERYVDTGIFESALYDGIPEALAGLRARGRRLHLATSKPRVFALRILERFGLREAFDSVHGCELDGTRTDKGELIAHLLRTEPVDPARAVMVGDRKHDAIGARANGVDAIGVLWGYGSRAELEAAGVIALCARPAELGGCAAPRPVTGIQGP